MTTETTNTELSGVDNGGQSPNYDALFGELKQQLESERAEKNRITSEVQSLKSTIESNQQIFERLKSTFNGGETKEENTIMKEIAALEDEQQQWIEQALEAERRGSPMPRTAKLGIERCKDRIELLKLREAHQKELKELNEKVSRFENPEYLDDKVFFTNADRILDRALDGVYGEDKDAIKYQKNTVVSILNEKFGDLRNNKPEEWQRLKRDPKVLQAAISEAVAIVVPPRAREIMKDYQLASQPKDINEMMGLFRSMRAELKKDPKNEKLRSDYDKLRQEIDSELTLVTQRKSFGQGRNSKLKIG